MFLIWHGFVGVIYFVFFMCVCHVCVCVCFFVKPFSFVLTYTGKKVNSKYKIHVCLVYVNAKKKDLEKKKHTKQGQRFNFF